MNGCYSVFVGVHQPRMSNCRPSEPRYIVWLNSTETVTCSSTISFLKKKFQLTSYLAESFQSQKSFLCELFIIIIVKQNKRSFSSALIKGACQRLPLNDSTWQAELWPGNKRRSQINKLVLQRTSQEQTAGAFKQKPRNSVRNKQCQHEIIYIFFYH